MKPWQTTAAALALGLVLGLLAADASRPRVTILVCDDPAPAGAWL